MLDRLTYLAPALIFAAACDGGGNDGGTVDAAPGDATAATDGATVDGTAVVIDARPLDAAAPINVDCGALPVTLPGRMVGFDRIDYGTICFSPASAPAGPECRVVDTYAQNVSAYCAFGGALLGKILSGPAAGGDVYLSFGFGTQIVSFSGGSVAGTDRILQIPNGPPTWVADFRGGFNTNMPSTQVYRVYLNFNANGSLTVSGIGALP